MKRMISPGKEKSTSRKVLFFLSAGHLVNDLYSNFLPPFIPHLLTRLHLSLTQAGSLAAVQMISSSLMQPLFGLLSDRYQRRLFTALGPCVTAVFISSLGHAPSFLLLALLLFFGGLGVGAFHPPAAAMAGDHSGGRKGLGMSLFVSAGSIGYAVGPLVAAFLMGKAGASGLSFAIIPGLAMSCLLFFNLPPGYPASPPSGGEAAPPQGRGDARGWNLNCPQGNPASGSGQAAGQSRVARPNLASYVASPLLLLFLLVVIRSAVGGVFSSFLPLYLVGKGVSHLAASEILTLFLAVGGVGGFLGGVLSDRFGGKRVILLSMLLSFPCLLGFLSTSGWIRYPLLILGGGFLFSTLPVNITLAQGYSQKHASTISAFMMGFAWGTGGMLVPLFGFVADQFSLQASLVVAAFFPVLGLLFALLLPGESSPVEGDCCLPA